jgi:hypothetical protein
MRLLNDFSPLLLANVGVMSIRIWIQCGLILPICSKQKRDNNAECLPTNKIKKNKEVVLTASSNLRKYDAFDLWPLF